MKSPCPRPLFLRACLREKTERTPVWIMRQAGRYLPEYQKIRIKTPFLKLCKTPELAARVTLQPVDILKVDAAIIFSDILLIPEAMGLHLSMVEKEGPRLSPPIQTPQGVRSLKRPDPERAYDFLGKALKIVRGYLPAQIPLIGFAGSPWTLMAYMVEGKGSRDFAKVKRFLYHHRKLAHQLLTKLADAVTDSLNYQIEEGAQAIQIFDSWGGVLSPPDFEEFSLGYVKRVMAGIGHKDIPRIFFAKGTGLQLEKIRSCGADVIGLDWTVDLAWARKIAKGRVALQGNLDPCLLYAPPQKIREAVKKMLEEMKGFPGYIFNLGHGILPDTPVKNAMEAVRAVKQYSSQF